MSAAEGAGSGETAALTGSAAQLPREVWRRHVFPRLWYRRGAAGVEDPAEASAEASAAWAARLACRSFAVDIAAAAALCVQLHPAWLPGPPGWQSHFPGLRAISFSRLEPGQGLDQQQQGAQDEEGGVHPTVAQISAAICPSLTAVDLSDCGGPRGLRAPQLTALSDLPGLLDLRLRSCFHTGCYGGAELASMASTDALAGVMASMAVLSGMTTLTSLDLSYCDALTNQHVAAAVSRLTRLQRLELTGCSQVTDGVLPSLAPLQSLQSLCAAHCYDMLSASAPSLAALTALTELDLTHCYHLSMPGLLAGAACLPSLSALYLAGCDALVGGDLGALGRLPSLTKLSLRENEDLQLSAALLGALPRLRSLDLADCFLIGAADLAPLHLLPHLHTLCLDSCVKVGDEALDALTGCAELRNLSLAKCYQVTDEGLGKLASLPQLTALDISCIVRVTDAGLLELQAAPSLAHLNAGGCSVTACGVGLLLSQLPRVHITFRARTPVFTWATEGCHHHQASGTTW